MAGPHAHRIHSTGGKEGGRAANVTHRSKADQFAFHLAGGKEGGRAANVTHRSKADQLAFHSAGGKEGGGSAAAAKGVSAYAEANRAAAPVATLSAEEYQKRVKAATRKLQRAWSKAGEHGPQPDAGDGRALVASGKY